MRALTTAESVQRFMAVLGRSVGEPVDVFFTGGVTAVLFDWRPATVDIDVKFVPDADAALRAIPQIKTDLNLNVELAAPDDFIPQLPGWRDRCLFIGRHGLANFFHYDPYSQALAKIERGHEQDRQDVRSMLADGLVDRGRLMELFEAIEAELYRFPAIDPRAYRQSVEAWVRGDEGASG